MLVAIAALLAGLVAGLTALGVWQLQRRIWKLDLIRQVEARVHAPPVPAPGPDQWPAIRRDKDQYRRVFVRGVLLNDRETLVQAATERGAGFWVLTPLRTDDGAIVLINRGFVPPDRRRPDSRPASLTPGEQTITGLLRMTEPKGGFLRANDPAHDLWRSRDVAAIAEARHLPGAAPYFIDAADSGPGGLPVGGLTVIRFPNSHLVYALTWFALASMLAGAAIHLVRQDIRQGRTEGAADQ